MKEFPREADDELAEVLLAAEGIKIQAEADYERKLDQAAEATGSYYLGRKKLEDQGIDPPEDEKPTEVVPPVTQFGANAMQAMRARQLNEALDKAGSDEERNRILALHRIALERREQPSAPVNQRRTR
jgi:hypothetical protein